MSRSSDNRFTAADRGAVEPLAALVAVLAVGAALGLYAGVVNDVGTDTTGEPTDAADVMDRIERDVTVGGVARPSRLDALDETRVPTTVELEADGESWQAGLGGARETEDRSGAADRRSESTVERRATVRVGAGQNVAGTLRVVIHE